MVSKPVIGIDLDGTVLDCRPRQEAVLLQIIPEAKIHVDALWELKRDGHSTQAALAQINLTAPDDFVEAWMSMIEARYFLELDQTLPGAKAALKLLGVVADLHLITSRQDPVGVFDTLNRLEINEFFSKVEVVPIGSEAAKAKAHHLQRSNAIAHCGDTEIDGNAAINAKVHFCAVTCGQRSEKFLSENTRAMAILPSLYDIAQSKIF